MWDEQCSHNNRTQIALIAYLLKVQSGRQSCAVLCPESTAWGFDYQLCSELMMR